MGEAGHLVGILPQIWPHSAGLGAPLVYQESCKPETTPGGAFSSTSKIEKLKATLRDTNDWCILLFSGLKQPGAVFHILIPLKTFCKLVSFSGFHINTFFLI